MGEEKNNDSELRQSERESTKKSTHPQKFVKS